MGLDGHLTLAGVDVKAEFVTNPQYFIYPVGNNAGKRFQKRTTAFFINAVKRYETFSFGLELFQLDPDS